MAIEYYQHRYTGEEIDKKLDDMASKTWVNSQGFLTSGTMESVTVTVTSTVSGVSVAGLSINVYYNNSTTIQTTLVTDSNGQATITVPAQTYYKLAFPSITGCDDVGEITHTAVLAQRNIEVVYRAKSTETEELKVFVRNKSDAPISGATVTVKYGSTTLTDTTTSTGNLAFTVPIGQTYTVTLTPISGYYMNTTAYTQTYTAERTTRSCYFELGLQTTGFYIVTDDGVEYDYDSFSSALAAGTVLASDAVAVKIGTSSLVNAGGVFLLDIDLVVNRSYGATKKWAASNVQFNSIPTNGSTASQPYYYDGLTASQLIQGEGDSRNIDTPAVDNCMSRTLTVNGQTHQGFLGSEGQWRELWNNVRELDDLLELARPDGTYTLSSLTSNKWTSTQNSATYARYWTTSGYGNNKTIALVALPFFAY